MPMLRSSFQFACVSFLQLKNFIVYSCVIFNPDLDGSAVQKAIFTSVDNSLAMSIIRDNAQLSLTDPFTGSSTLLGRLLPKEHAALSQPSRIEKAIEAARAHCKSLHESFMSLEKLHLPGRGDPPGLPPKFHGLSVRLHLIQQEWFRMPQFEEMKAALRSQTNAAKLIHEIDCFAIGSIWRPWEVEQENGPDAPEKTACVVRRLLQLAIMLSLAEYLNRLHHTMSSVVGMHPRRVEMYAQDPEVTDEDIEFLGYFHITLTNERTALQERVKGNSLYYAPHLDPNIDVSALFEAKDPPPLVFESVASNNPELMRMRSGVLGYRKWADLHGTALPNNYEPLRMPSWERLAPVGPFRMGPPITLDRYVFMDMCFWVRKTDYKPPGEIFKKTQAKKSQEAGKGKAAQVDEVGQKGNQSKMVEDAGKAVEQDISGLSLAEAEPVVESSKPGKKSKAKGKKGKKK